MKLIVTGGRMKSRIKKPLPDRKKCARITPLKEKAMNETLFLKLDRNSASPTESADEGKETIGNTQELTV